MSWISEYNYDEWLLADKDALTYMVSAYLASYALGMESEKGTEFKISCAVGRCSLRLSLSTLESVASRHLSSPTNVIAQLTLSRRSGQLWGILPNEFTNLWHKVDFHGALCQRGIYWGKDDQHQQRLASIFDDSRLELLDITEVLPHKDAKSFTCRYSSNTIDGIVCLLCMFQFEFENVLNYTNELAIDIVESAASIELLVDFGTSQPGPEVMSSRSLLKVIRTEEERYQIFWWPIDEAISEVIE